MSKSFCPQCGNTLNNCVCHMASPIKNDKRCRYVDEKGITCNKEGSVSPGLRGEGSWYCCVDHARKAGAF